MKIFAKNKKAYFDYEILSKFEAGIALKGWEVKSIRNGSASLKESYVKIENGELFVYGMNISRWKTQSKLDKIDTLRPRKLLLHKAEIKRIFNKVAQKGLTIIPLQLYLSRNNHIKVEIGIAKGKKKYDKRRQVKEKDQKKQIERDLGRLKIK